MYVNKMGKVDNFRSLLFKTKKYMNIKITIIRTKYQQMLTSRASK